MAKLTEPFVEASSIEYLKKYYSSKHRTETIFAKSQAYTVAKFNGIADGFLCLNSVKQDYHSVSIEAKSHKTLINLKPYFMMNKFIAHVLLFSLLLAFIPMYFVYNLEWYWLVVLYLSFSIAIFFLFTLMLDKAQPFPYKRVDVVEQISRYPANEKWISISSDSVRLLKERKSYLNGCSYKNLLRICKRKGIGLVVVNHIDCKILLYPKFKKGKFLSCYKFKNEVEEHFSLN